MTTFEISVILKPRVSAAIPEGGWICAVPTEATTLEEAQAEARRMEAEESPSRHRFEARRVIGIEEALGIAEAIVTLQEAEML